MKKIVFRHLFLVILSSRWPRLSHTIIRRHKTIFPARGWRARETRLLMDRAWLGHNRSMSESDPLSFITSPSNALRLAKENFFSVCNFTFGMFCARNSALSIGSSWKLFPLAAQCFARLQKRSKKCFARACLAVRKVVSVNIEARRRMVEVK
jgi:hypothetical protein